MIRIPIDTSCHRCGSYLVLVNGMLAGGVVPRDAVDRALHNKTGSSHSRADRQVDIVMPGVSRIGDRRSSEHVRRSLVKCERLPWWQESRPASSECGKEDSDSSRSRQTRLTTLR
jgi:hypothetical protein